MTDLLDRLRLTCQLTHDPAAAAAIGAAIREIERLRAERDMLRHNISHNLRKAIGCLYLPPDDPAHGPVWRAFRRLGGP